MSLSDSGNGIKFPRWIRGYVSYVLPLIVLFIFVQGYWSKFFAPLMKPAQKVKTQHTGEGEQNNQEQIEQDHFFARPTPKIHPE